MNAVEGEWKRARDGSYSIFVGNGIRSSTGWGGGKMEDEHGRGGWKERGTEW